MSSASTSHRMTKKKTFSRYWKILRLIHNWIIKVRKRFGHTSFFISLRFLHGSTLVALIRNIWLTIFFQKKKFNYNSFHNRSKLQNIFPTSEFSWLNIALTVWHDFDKISFHDMNHFVPTKYVSLTSMSVSQLPLITSRFFNSTRLTWSRAVDT